jgi:hypothetical protein
MIPFAVSLVLLELLVLRERERLAAGELATVLSVWPVFACLAYVRVALAGDDEPHFWPTAAALYLLVIAVTGARPALILVGVLGDEDRLTASERRRGRVAQIVVGIAAALAGLLPEVLS